MTNPQIPLDLGGRPTVRLVLDRIRTESRDESEKGRWFEQLFMRVARQEPEFEIDAIWRWPDWPERERLTGLDGRDIGIDLVGRRITGEWVAVQCKCYDDAHILGKGEIDVPRSFPTACLSPSLGRGDLSVGTECRKGDSKCPSPGDPNRLPSVPRCSGRGARRQAPRTRPLAAAGRAIEDVVTGLANHERGRLIMACGTGKTFTALRVAEQLVADGERILFAAPTIALVSQARREWLRQTTRPLKCIVVCSDATAGGRNETEDIRVSELECPVSTDPAEIAASLAGDGPTRVVFCTYHSLRRVTEAQAHHAASHFDLGAALLRRRSRGVQEGLRAAWQELLDPAKAR